MKGLQNVAALQLWFGQDAEYAATCQRAIEAVEKSPENLDIAARAAQNRCLQASEDAAKVLPPGTDQNHIVYWLAYKEAKALKAKK